tara:strand:- start:147 stop:884 length:738 start_codon:yes stop_codon:yes gene_type:complete
MPVIIPAAIGLVGGVGKMIGRGQANRQMRKLLAEQPKYKENQLATTQLNARMPGAAQAERNIYGEQANILGRSQQAATSSSDVLQQLGGVQAQTNQALQGLAGQEAVDYQRRYQNYTTEKDKAFEDQLRQFQNRAQIEGGIQENKQNSWGDVSSMGFGVANFAAQGGFNKGGFNNKDIAGTRATPTTPTLIPPQSTVARTLGTSVTQSPMQGQGLAFPPMQGLNSAAMQQYYYNDPWQLGGNRIR